MHNPQTSHVYPVRNRKPVSLRTPHSCLTSTTPDTFALGARCRGLRLNRCPTDTRPPNQPGSTNARPEDADLLVARDTAAHSAQVSREKPPTPKKCPEDTDLPSSYHLADGIYKNGTKVLPIGNIQKTRLA